jgi:hypothetical protein
MLNTTDLLVAAHSFDMSPQGDAKDERVLPQPVEPSEMQCLSLVGIVINGQIGSDCVALVLPEVPPRGQVRPIKASTALPPAYQACPTVIRAVLWIHSTASTLPIKKLDLVQVSHL